jgi:hypothetical protein
MLLLRVPYLLLDIPLLQPELIWMLTGERMAEGYSMYKDIIDDTGPLSAGIYWLIHELIGSSPTVYQLIAAFIILFQISYFNSFLIHYKAFEDNTYIPALVMVVLVHLSFDFLTLSPALMGGTFILLALGQLFSQTVRHQDSPESVLLVGLFGGTALCFHFPFVVFLPFIVVAGVAISGFSLLQLVLCLTGYFLPIILCGLYYFWIDSLGDFMTLFVFATRFIDAYAHMSYWQMAQLFLLPLVFTLGGFFIGSVIKRLTVNQQKQNQLIILFFVFSLTSIFVANRIVPYQLVVLLPGMAFFISQIFIYLKKNRLKAIVFYSFFLGVPLGGYIWKHIYLNAGEENSYAVNSGNKYDFTDHQAILVLGDDLGFYRNSSLAGPYLNYALSKVKLTEVANAENLTKIYRVFSEEKPVYVIDEDGIFANLLQYLPELKENYNREREGVYRLK